jgi:energy-converting hydrogenase A subunit R
MLEAINQSGGLAIAFNANEYALPYATLSLASTHLSDLNIVLDAWERGGREAVQQVVKEKERLGGAGDREHFHWLEGVKDLEAPLDVHRRIRRLVREEAAKLG